MELKRFLIVPSLLCHQPAALEKSGHRPHIVSNSFEKSLNGLEKVVGKQLLEYIKDLCPDVYGTSIMS